jgi:hypothetical protein
VSHLDSALCKGALYLIAVACATTVGASVHERSKHLPNTAKPSKMASEATVHTDENSDTVLYLL